MSETLFGPYGSELDKLVLQGQITAEERNSPQLILRSDALQRATGDISSAYLSAGAHRPTSNTFWARNVLEQDADLYTAVIGTHIDLVWKRVQALGVSGTSAKVLTTLGPKGSACYSPSSAPEADEAEEFHGKQLDLLLKAASERAIPVIPLFETFSSLEEAKGAARALRRRPKIQEAYLSFPFSIDGLALGDQGPFEGFVRELREVGDFTRLRLGFNCGPIEGLATALESLGELNEYVHVAYPNASSHHQTQLETLEGHHGVLDARRTSQFMRHLQQAFRLQIIGGCCGYTPEDLHQLSFETEASDSFPPTDVHPQGLVRAAA